MMKSVRPKHLLMEEPFWRRFHCIISLFLQVGVGMCSGKREALHSTYCGMNEMIKYDWFLESKPGGYRTQNIGC
jgi:hypothetical protein